MSNDELRWTVEDTTRRFILLYFYTYPQCVTIARNCTTGYTENLQIGRYTLSVLFVLHVNCTSARFYKLPKHLPRRVVA